MQNQHAPIAQIRRPLARALRIDPNSECICVWPENRVSVPHMWGILAEILGERQLRWVIKVSRVVQRNNRRLRLDVFVMAGVRAKSVLKRVVKAQKAHGWLARFHRAWEQRRSLRRRRGAAANLNLPATHENHQTGSLKFSTWNIHSVANKRPELEMYLRQTCTAVLALQETARSSEHWPIRVRGYQCFEAPAMEHQPGQRGLALLVRQDLAAYQVGQESPYLLIAKVTVADGDDLTIASVYVPPRGYAGRSVALRQIRKAAEGWMRQRVGVKAVIMGDWNMSRTQLAKMLAKWNTTVPLLVNRCSGSAVSWTGGRNWADLDHMVVSPEAAVSVSRAVVDRSWDLSDHWPLRATWSRGAHGRANGQAPGNGANSISKWKLGLMRDEEKSALIAHHNVWNTLFLDEEAEEAQTEVTEFERAVREVGGELGLLEEVNQQREGPAPAYRLSGRARRAINQRRRRHEEWAEEEAPERGELWARYEEARRKAKAATRAAMQRSWNSFIRGGADKLAGHQMREYWQWARRIMGRSRASGSNLIIDPLTGRTVSEPQAVKRTWASHYRSLAADATGHSRDFQYWQDQFPDIPMQHILPGMDAAVTWAELNGALSHLRNWKAPGVDGIPGEFYKAAVQSTTSEEYDGVNPPSELGRMLLRMADRVMRTGQIPNQWQEALVVSIPKKGDLKQMDNYRGISLIAVALKLVTVVAIRRVQRGLETRGWFRQEQAGFRFREECPAQTTALYEIVQRRRAAGHGTYLAFVDMRKAYDTVPHGALLRKMWLAGVRGRVFRFMQSLYDDARMAVLTKHGRSEAVPVLRGVRQGCPASPTIFNIFVNDILDGFDLEGLGVSVPGLQSRVAGLLFADDLVIMAPTRGRLVRMLRKLDEWAERNEMSFGIAKCGVMGVGVKNHHDLMARLRREPERWHLGGEQVPIVDSYTYLGLVVNSDLDLKVMAADRASKGWKVLRALKPVLASSRIPLAMRLHIVKYILVPTLAFGGELWGMSVDRSAQVEKVLSAALRALFRLGDKSRRISPIVIGMETGVCPVAARVAGSKARAFHKYPNLRTVVASLVRNPAVPAKLMRGSWVRGSGIWLARWGPAMPEVDVGNVIQPHVAAKLVREHVWGQRARVVGGVGAQRYSNRDMRASNGYIAAAVRYPQHAMGVHWLSRARVGTVWMARDFVRIGWLPEYLRTQCPFCDEGYEGETLVHFLVECPRWNEARLNLQPLIDKAEEVLGLEADVENLAVYLLGGRVGGEQDDGVRCKHWVKLPRNPQRDNIGNVDDVDDGVAVEDRVPGFILVARFFEAVMPTRLAELSPLLPANPPRADAQLGMAALQQDENDYVLP